MSTEWTRLDGADDTIPTWVKREHGFLFVAHDAFGEPDVYRMVLLDDGQVTQLREFTDAAEVRGDGDGQDGSDGDRDGDRQHAGDSGQGGVDKRDGATVDGRARDVGAVSRDRPPPATAVRGHELYEPADFTPEELDRRNALAIAVVEGGLGVCKRCGAAEAQLDEFTSCAAYWRHKRRGADAAS